MIDLSTITSEITNLELLAKSVVEGFITGMHKSPFHGFSVEFSEHKLYNKGESTRNIDWKLYAKTEKLYTKKYEEETNLRCHVIIDNSASMHYPIREKINLNTLNKISFSAVATACLMELLKKQRDAVGLSIYADSYEYYAPEKGSNRHHKMLLNTLGGLLTGKSTSGTDTYKYLHEIAEKLHKRSLIILFTDMLQTTTQKEKLFEALQHLKYNKHELLLFHTYDAATEFNLDFGTGAKKIVDVETGEAVPIYTENFKIDYKKAIQEYFEEIKYKCMQNKITYIPVDISLGFSEVLVNYLLLRKKSL